MACEHDPVGDRPHDHGADPLVYWEKLVADIRAILEVPEGACVLCWCEDLAAKWPDKEDQAKGINSNSFLTG